MSQAVSPLISGNVLVMANPTLTSTALIVQNAQRNLEMGIHEEESTDVDACDDGGANILLNQEIQQYYQQHGLATKVKAAGLLSIDEAKQLAGIAAVTLAPDLLRELASTHELEDDLVKASIFKENTKSLVGQDTGMASYMDDETKYREAFAKSIHGKGEWRMKQAIEIFSDFQIKGEALMRDNESTSA
ncbi:MAG: hypothetical protein Q9183_003044 [Haloplaca sp. 2 TL-2023]